MTSLSSARQHVKPAGCQLDGTPMGVHSQSQPLSPPLPALPASFGFNRSIPSGPLSSTFCPQRGGEGEGTELSLTARHSMPGPAHTSRVWYTRVVQHAKEVLRLDHPVSERGDDLARPSLVPSERDTTSSEQAHISGQRERSRLRLSRSHWWVVFAPLIRICHLPHHHRTPLQISLLKGDEATHQSDLDQILGWKGFLWGSFGVRTYPPSSPVDPHNASPSINCGTNWFIKPYPVVLPFASELPSSGMTRFK